MLILLTNSLPEIEFKILWGSNIIPIIGATSDNPKISNIRENNTNMKIPTDPFKPPSVNEEILLKIVIN